VPLIEAAVHINAIFQAKDLPGFRPARERHPRGMIVGNRIPCHLSKSGDGEIGQIFEGRKN